MKEKIHSKEEKKETVLEVEDSEQDLDVSSESEDDSTCNEKKEKDDNFDKCKEKTSNVDITDENLKTPPSKKYYPPSYSKGSHHRGRFTSTWVQYADSDGLGYAYGGADTLNYDPTTKNRFIRRVFIILIVMTSITCVYNFASAKTDLQDYYRGHVGVLAIAMFGVILIFLNCYMACSECTRSPPFSYMSLFMTLIGTCVVSGFFSGYFNTLLLMYVYITRVVVAIAFVLIANTSYNFTHWTLHIIGVCVALPVILGFYFVAYNQAIEHVTPVYPLFVLYIFIGGALLNIIILTSMLQIILASRAVEILEDDYTVGAFYLYTSGFDIYIKLVQLCLTLFEKDED